MTRTHPEHGQTIRRPAPSGLAQPRTPLAANPRTYLLLLLGVLCIGFSPIFTRWAAVPGTVSACYRLSIATVALLPLVPRMFRRSQREAGRTLWLVAIASGLFFALDLALFNSSLFLTRAANATLLDNDAPLVVGFYALFILRERLRGRYWLGLLIALLGMGVIAGGDHLANATLGLGDALALVAGVSYAGSLIATQRARERLSPLGILWIAALVGAVLLLVYNLLAGRALWGFAPASYVWLLALGLISQVIGWLCINDVLGKLPASIVSVTLLAQPVVTALLAVPLLGEPLSPPQVIGGLIALGGIFLVNRSMIGHDVQRAPRA